LDAVLSTDVKEAVRSKHLKVQTASATVIVFIARFLVRWKELLRSFKDHICEPVAVVFIQIIVWLVLGDNEEKG
jgi:predicted thioredoxin/glutaredoxin